MSSHPPHPDAARHGGVALAADRAQRVAERRPLQHDPRHQADGRRAPDEQRNAEQFALAESEELVGKWGDLALHEDVDQPGRDEEHRQRRDHRRHLEHNGERSANGAGRGARQHPDDDRCGPEEAVGHECARDDGSDGERRTHREVQTSRDHQQADGARDDEVRARRSQDLDEVGLRDEDGGPHRSDDRHGRDHRRQHRVRPSPESGHAGEGRPRRGAQAAGHTRP